MSRSTFAKILLILFILSAISCSFNKKPSGAKVHIVALGLCYEGKNFLESPVRDVVEFTEYYRNILESKNIDYEVYYMLDYAYKEYISDTGYVYISGSDASSSYYPTVANLNSVFDTIKKKSSEKDLLVFLYSGHGTETNSIDELTGDTVWTANDNGALCLRGVEKFNGEMIPSLKLDAYMLPNLVEKLKSLPLSKTVIMDSCFSGALIGSILDGESVGESIGGKGNVYVAQDNFYKVAFESLDEVINFAAVTASRANETSSEVGSYYGEDDGIFNGESHGLLFGSVLEGLGFTHSKVQKFSSVPSAGAENQKIHSSLRSTFDVYGVLPEIAFMKSLEFSTNEIFKISRKANKDYNETYGTTQLTQQHFGPVGIKLAW